MNKAAILPLNSKSKRLAILLTLLGVVNCDGTLPPAPDVDFCFGINTGSIATDYAFCRGYLTTSRESRIGAREVFRQKYIMLSPKDYERLINYKNRLEDLAEDRCR